MSTDLWHYNDLISLRRRLPNRQGVCAKTSRVSDASRPVTFRELIEQALANTTDTYAVIGRRLGVAQATISGWKSGQVPRPDKMPAIAAWLGLDEEEVWASLVRQHQAPSPEEAMAALEARIDALERNTTKRLRSLERQLADLVRTAREGNQPARRPSPRNG